MVRAKFHLSRSFFIFFLIFNLNFILNLILPLSARALEKPALQEFFPQGLSKNFNQILARFSQEMVPLGPISKDLAVPFEFQCTSPLKGSGQWVDSKTWVWNLPEDLPAGQECRFTLKPGLKTLKGETLEREGKDPPSYSFSTGGPEIKESRPWEGESSIPEDAAFILFLDGSPDLKTVLENAYFLVEGLEEKINIDVADEKTKNEVLKTLYLDSEQQKRPSLMVTAKRTFPHGKSVKLVWGKGITTEKSTIPTQKEQILNFKTREAFHLSMSCQRENFNSPCHPFTPLTVNFSSPVAWDLAKKFTLVSEKGKKWEPFISDWMKNQNEVHYVEFRGPFPTREKFTVQVPADLTDRDGRKPQGPNLSSLVFQTADVPPLVKFSAPFGLLEWIQDEGEKGQAATLPVSIRKAEADLKAHVFSPGQKGLQDPKEIIKWIQEFYRYREQQPPAKPLLDKIKNKSTVKTLKLPSPKGKATTEVIGIPLSQPGFYLVEIVGKLLGESLHPQRRPYPVSTSALVTNLSVHFKKGRDNSLVWVTELSSGSPAAQVQVSVFNCAGEKLWTGKTDGEGLARIPVPENKLPEKDCKRKEAYYPLTYETGLYVFAQKGKDLSFVHTSWNEGIETWRFALPYFETTGPFIPHTVLDRPLFRSGETVSMKHFYRRESSGAVLPVTAKQLPSALDIVHLGSSQKYTLPLKWEAGQSSFSTWTIPREAKLGTYRLYMKGNPSGEFAVEEFKVPLMKATFKSPDTSPATLKFWVEYLGGGGPAAELPVKLRIKSNPLESARAPHKNLANYHFNNGPLPPDQTGQEETTGGETANQDKMVAYDLKLDKNGHGTFSLPGDFLKAQTRFPSQVVEVLSELEYADPNGEVQTTASSFLHYPSDFLLGIESTNLPSEKHKIRLSAVVTNRQGHIQPKVPVKMEFFKRISLSHRKKVVGGFYAYENRSQTIRQEPSCDGQTDAKGFFVCEVELKESGDFFAQVEAVDPKGTLLTSHRSFWLTGDQNQWWGGQDHDRIDLVPLKKEYRPGEIMQIQIQTPFAEATALVTVEREGILDSFVKTITRQQPLMEIPVKNNYAPNIYLSAMVVRGRVGDIQPTPLVDLGRPSYKFGMTHLEIDHQHHRLQVNLKSDKDVYQIRDTAEVTLEVRQKDGSLPPAGTEVTVSAVDMGLLELRPNQSWDLLERMLAPKNLEVQTFTAQMQVVGKRHFGQKAQPEGGGGGQMTTRELFETLLAWIPRVKLDKEGKARVKIPLNDSVTGFTVAAIAAAPVPYKLFGTGLTSFRSTKDLTVFAGLPSIAREGDQIMAEFTLRNTGNKKLDLVTSLTQEFAPELLFPEQKVTLAPGEGKMISWKVFLPGDLLKTTAPSMDLAYLFQARDKGAVLDALKIKQKLLSSSSVHPYQVTLLSLKPGEKATLTLEKSPTAHPHKGGVRVQLQHSLVGDLAGVKDYMKHYPYSCLEQKISKSVSLENPGQWKDIMDRLPAYMGESGLLHYFPLSAGGGGGGDEGQGNSTLTSYLLTLAHESGYPIPADLQEKMLEGLNQFVTGKIPSGTSSSGPAISDLPLRKIEAIEALSRYNLAQVEMLDSLPFDPAMWPTSTLLQYFSLLKRMKTPPLLQKNLAEVEKRLRGKLTMQGSFIMFDQNNTSQPWWQMVSADLNTLRLISTVMEFQLWTEDVPRLVRGALHRQKGGHWDLTTANAWGTVAARKFKKIFEKDPANFKGTTTLVLSDPQTTKKTQKIPTDFVFPLPQKRAALDFLHEGQGQPWALAQIDQAIPLTEPLSQGFTLKKEFLPARNKWEKGEVIRVVLTLTAQNDMTWVVVNDPIPAGAVILGKGLKGQSSLNASSSGGSATFNALYPSFEEKGGDSYRSYFEFVPKGTWQWEYHLRPNTKGTFTLPPSRAEAMYLPEMRGEIPNEKITVE